MNVTQFVLIFCGMVGGYAILALFIRHRTIMLRDQLDGRLTELLRVTKELAHAQGVAEGRKEKRKSERSF